MSELLPCPFCGGEAHTLNQAPKGTGYSVGCDDDECRGFIALSWIYATEDEAFEAWNTRAERIEVYPDGESGISINGIIYVPERTCKPLGTIRYDYEGGYAGFEYETDLSCGHKWCDSYGDYPDFCPNCGAKVVSE